MPTRNRPAFGNQSSRFRQILQWFGLFICLLLTLFGLFYFFGQRLLTDNRYSVVVLGDPIEVVSIDSDRSRVVTIRFPKETMVDGISGLGSYRLDALWSVAATDASPSSVLLESLTDELGVPLDRYIAYKGTMWGVHKEDGPLFPLFFSPTDIVQFLTHGFDTNLSLREFIGLTRVLMNVDRTKISEYELTKDNGLSHEIGPDAVESLTFDRTAFDRITTDLFQDTLIRQEGKRVAVFNTTDKARLGTRVARIVNKLGGQVVQVGNDGNLVNACELVGTKDALSSRTAVVLQQIFSCEERVSDEGIADITIRVGKAYAEKYAPKQ